MRIALVILHADPARGGAERYTVDLSAALVARGHDVSLLASSFASVPPGVTEVRLDGDGITRVGKYRRFLESLDASLDEGGFDIVHAMLPVHKCDVYHPHAGIAADAASGNVLRQLNRRRAEFAEVEKRLLGGDHPPVVLSLSDVIARVVKKWYPNLPADRLVKLFNGVDTEKFRPVADETEKRALRARFGLPRDGVLALMIAQDFDRKGLGPTIQAMKTVDGRVELVVAGRDDPKPFQRLAATSGVAKRVHWLGPTDDPASLYRAVDFFVLPTRHDPCSLVVLESLASGVPVVTTEANGAAEIMTPGRHGFILLTPDPGLIATAMNCLADPSICLAIGAECRTLRTMLSQEGHLIRLDSAYEELREMRRRVKRPGGSANPA